MKMAAALQLCLCILAVKVSYFALFYIYMTCKLVTVRLVFYLISGGCKRMVCTAHIFRRYWVFPVAF